MFKKILKSVLFVLIYSPAYSYTLLEPRHMALEVTKYQRLNDPYLAPIDRDIAFGGAFKMDWYWLKLDKLSLYSQNKLHFLQSGKDGQVKFGGWQYEQGLSLFGKVELFKYHHSQHVFEATKTTHFPNNDHIGIRLIFLSK